MIRPESTEITAVKFINSWKNNPSRLSAELISLHNETNRKKDIYSFTITPEGLIDPVSQQPVRQFILKETALQKEEYQAFQNLESWAQASPEGLALWISPPSSLYPCAKAIFSRIVYDFSGTKHLTNSAILFGNDTTDCQDIVPRLTPESKNNLRGAIFNIDESEEDLLAEILQNITKYSAVRKPAVGKLNPKQIQKFTGMIEKGLSPTLIVAEMQKTGFLGQHSISCPTFASEIILANSKIFTVSSEFKPGICRMCHKHTEVGPCKICKTCEKKFN